jgi:hypothetical protein
MNAFTPITYLDTLNPAQRRAVVHGALAQWQPHRCSSLQAPGRARPTHWRIASRISWSVAPIPAAFS